MPTCALLRGRTMWTDRIARELPLRYDAWWTKADGGRGPAVPVSDVRIVDPETRADLPTGRTGLLLVRGPQVMKCYYSNAGEFAPASGRVQMAAHPDEQMPRRKRWTATAGSTRATWPRSIRKGLCTFAIGVSSVPTSAWRGVAFHPHTCACRAMLIAVSQRRYHPWR